MQHPRVCIQSSRTTWQCHEGMTARCRHLGSAAAATACDSCGLRMQSQDTPTEQQLDAVVEFLTSRCNLAKDDIAPIAKEFPQLFGCDVEKQLEYAVGVLENDWFMKGKILTSTLSAGHRVWGAMSIAKAAVGASVIVVGSDFKRNAIVPLMHAVPCEHCNRRDFAREHAGRSHMRGRPH